MSKTEEVFCMRNVAEADVAPRHFPGRRSGGSGKGSKGGF